MYIIRKYFLLLLFFFFISHSPAAAQFEEPDIEKISNGERKEFMQRFDDIKWTGRGLYGEMVIDTVRSNKLRARLQARYGHPTQTLEDLINKEKFRPAEAIQFEYWFTVDDSIPLMVLDIDGPFGEGLVYGGASRYIDLMPQVKRTLSEKLMSVESPAEFQDYFYSPEREQWFDVRFENGEFVTREIDSPKGMTIDFDF